MSEKNISELIGLLTFIVLVIYMYLMTKDL